MTPDWWTKPYEGGGPAKPKGFPRPLYPPDASGPASPDGPDVIAYKRTICRLGRWGEWDPNQWDPTYSNKFAHGRGGDVKDTGVEGFQRQMNIQPTGNIGEKTFNALRYALVPEGKPNEGEQAMDGVAVDMINQAYDLFNQPPAPPVKQNILNAMIALIGLQEQGPGSNNVPKITDWYGLPRQPWCAMTCARAGVDAGSKSYSKGERWHYCPTIISDAKAKRHGLSIAYDSWGGGDIDNVTPGDMVVFDWDGSGFSSSNNHVGMFEKWLNKAAGYFQTVEGNVNSECARHSRYISSQHTVFVNTE